MKARVTKEFRTQRPGERKNSSVEVGEVVEGALAKTAIDNGFADEVDEGTPVGKSEAAVVAPGKKAAEPSKAADKGGKPANAKGGKKANQEPPPKDAGGSGEAGDDDAGDDEGEE